jgi:hypothetical protein
MRFPAVSARAFAVAASLIGAALGPAPASGLAQPAPEDLVARCDLPVVDLFNPLPGDVLLPGLYMISGLALDPMAQQGSSGIDQVTFFLGDRDQGGQSLGTAVPSMGQRQADFSMMVVVPDSNAGTTQQLQAFAHSSLTGKETEVSMPVVLGMNPTPTNPSTNSADSINTNPGVLPQRCTSADAASPLAAPAEAQSGSQSSPSVAAPSVAAASTGSAMFGTVKGSVTTCQSGAEQPLTEVIVKAQGTSASAVTDEGGEFALSEVPAPGTYTIAVSDGGITAARMYVPVAPGETIDIGTLELGADPAAGCGDEDVSPGG